MKLTLGFSPCPNDTFIFDALIHGKIDTEGLEFEVSFEDVESLNRKAFNQELDITKLSYHAYAHVLKNYALLTAGSALGFGVGPLLITGPEGRSFARPEGQGPSSGPAVSSAKSPAQPGTKPTPSQARGNPPYIAPEARIGIPGQYTTANFLLSLAYPEATNKQEMVFSEIEGALLEGNIDFGLIIHENRFTYTQKGLQKVIDLGEFWEQQTGCPIPLGGIMVKRSLDPALQAAINRLIRRSIEFAYAHPGSGSDFIREHAQEMDEKVMAQHIELYVNKYSLDLGDEGRRAIEKMFTMAVSNGLIEDFREPLFAAGIAAG